MIDFARETVGILLPAADLLYRNAFPLLMQDVNLAGVVGKAVIGGVKCDHLLFSRPGVDFQVWVAEGKKALSAQVCRHGNALHAGHHHGPERLEPWSGPWMMPGSTSCRPRASRRSLLCHSKLPAGPTAETDRRKTMKPIFRIAGAVNILFLMGIADLPNSVRKTGA